MAIIYSLNTPSPTLMLRGGDFWVRNMLASNLPSLTAIPAAMSLIPSCKMLVAALMSRSCSVCHVLFNKIMYKINLYSNDHLIVRQA